MIEVRTPAAPVETVTPIRYSEAIRLGCLAYPEQAFGIAFKGNAACAIGAMNAGLGYGGEPMPPYLWGVISELPCPEGCERPGRSWGDFVGPGTPAHLNDDHRWSRERIADWLEGLGL